jgi:hypothetical protein
MKHLSDAETHVTEIQQASKIWPKSYGIIKSGVPLEVMLFSIVPGLAKALLLRFNTIWYFSYSDQT